MINSKHFHTLLPQSVGSKSAAVAPIITPSAAFGYENAEQAEGIFSGNVAKPLYARMGNPTNTQLESTLSKIEDAEGAIVTSSGMGAISSVILQICGAGDHIVSSRTIYGGSYAFMKNYLPKLNINTSFVDVTSLEKIEAAITKDTKIIYCEALSNPLL